MKVSYIMLLFPLFFSTIISGQQREYSLFDKAYHSISSNNIDSLVKELCSEKYSGRLAGSPEYTYCALWAANQFSSYGLTPGGDNGFFFQNFPIHNTIIKNKGLLQIIDDGISLDYKIQEDYIPGIHTSGGIMFEDVIYVGFGITAPEFLYDDYDGFDVKGKIVVIEPGVPCNPGSVNYKRWDESKYSGTIIKFQNAVNHGAAGVLFADLKPHPGIKHYKNFLYCHVNDKVINGLLSGTGKTASLLRSHIMKTEKPATLPINGKKVRIFFDSQQIPLSITQNVIAYIPGNNPKLKDSPVIVGAHLDHLGSPGVIFPGAADNASGSAVLMATAKAMAMSGIIPSRPIVFILFGAEEEGMIGSKYYIENPLFPLNKTLCMFNLDMVGNGTELRISGIDTLPQIKRYFTEANDKYLHRILNTTKYRRASGKMYTDGEVFNSKGVFAFSAGTRKSVGFTYYHSPLDVPETLTPEIMEDLSKLLFVSLYNLCTDDGLSID